MHHSFMYFECCHSNHYLNIKYAVHTVCIHTHMCTHTDTRIPAFLRNLAYSKGKYGVIRLIEIVMSVKSASKCISSSCLVSNQNIRNDK